MLNAVIFMLAAFFVILQVFFLKLFMKKSFIVVLIVISLLCLACTKSQKKTVGQHIDNTELFFVADTIHDGGLCLLHLVSILDVNGDVLFVDSVNDYEPDTCRAEMLNGVWHIVLRQFDPCNDSMRLVIKTDGKRLLSIDRFE